MKKGGGRDVKFIIYQVLYIFVICVIALKGADINLEEVIDVKEVVKRTYADSLKKYIDSLLALGLVPEISFDSTKKFTQEDMNVLMAKLQVNLQQPQITQNIEQPRIEKREQEQDPTKEEKRVEAKVQGVELTQYTSSTIKNPYNGTLEIIADGRTLATIPQGSSAKITLGGENSVTFRVGGSSDTKATRQNKPQVVTISRMGPSGPDASLRQVQGSVGFRVEITDDFPGQLDIKFDGPVSVKQMGGTTFDVTLNLLSSESAFDNWSKNREAPYKATFKVTVKDKISGHTETQGGTFTFGKW